MAKIEKEKKRSKFASGGTDREKADRFKAGGQIAMAALLVGGVLQAAWMSYTPNVLGPKGMGLFGPMIGWFYVIASVVALGLPQTICTFVSKHYETDEAEAKKFLSDGNKLNLIIGVSVVAGTVIIGGILRLAGVIDTFQYAMAFALMCSCVTAMIYWGINAILNGFQRVDLLSVGNLVFPVGQFGGTVVLIMLMQHIFGKGSRWEVVGAVAALGIGQFFGLVPALIIVLRTRMVTLGELIDVRRNHGLYKGILSFGGTAAVAMVANAVVQNFTAPMVRIVGLNFHVFDEVQIGYFSTALIFAMVPMLLCGVAIALIPAMSEAEAQGRKDMMQEYYTSAMQQCFAILAVIVAVYGIGIGKVVMLMDGPKFPEEILGPLAVRMVIGGAGVAMIFVLTNMFIGLKRPAVPAVISVLVLVGQITGIIVFSLVFRKIIWATIGFIFPPIIGTIVMLHIARKQMGLKFPWWTLLEPAGCAALSWAIVHFLVPQKFLFNLINGASTGAAAKLTGVMVFVPDLLLKIVVMIAIFAVPMVVFGKRRKKVAVAT